MSLAPLLSILKFREPKFYLLFLEIYWKMKRRLPVILATNFLFINKGTFSVKIDGEANVYLTQREKVRKSAIHCSQCRWRYQSFPECLRFQMAEPTEQTRDMAIKMQNKIRICTFVIRSTLESLSGGLVEFCKTKQNRTNGKQCTAQHCLLSTRWGWQSHN